VLGFDSARTEIYPVSFDPVILSSLHQTMAYAVSTCNNYNNFQSSIMSTSSSKFSKLQIYLRF